MRPWLFFFLVALAHPAASAPEVSERPALRSGDQVAWLRPSLRPDGIATKAMARNQALDRGAICGRRDIQGEGVGAVPGKIAGCGITDAVRVTSVSGIALSTPAVMDCQTAKALRSWVDKSAKPELKALGGLQTLRVAAHYVCRTRNHQPGAKISEHGKGRAIDISGFELANGTAITLSADWGRGAAGRALRRMHRGACGPFGTVLGPESDRFHRDHFHFDTARYRGGPYCR